MNIREPFKESRVYIRIIIIAKENHWLHMYTQGGMEKEDFFEKWNNSIVFHCDDQKTSYSFLSHSFLSLLKWRNEAKNMMTIKPKKKWTRVFLHNSMVAVLRLRTPTYKQVYLKLLRVPHLI